MLIALALLALGAGALAVAYAFEMLPVVRADVRSRVVAAPERSDAQTVRIVQPLHGLGVRRLWITPTQLAKLEANLAVAGKTADVLPRLLTIKLVAPLLVALMGWTLAGSRGPMSWLIVVFAVYVAYCYPDIYLRSRAAERRSEVERTLPDLLDQVTIALDAGMSFEAAFARVGSTHRGPLGAEITRTLQDMAVGMSRRAAYEAMAQRNDVEDLHKFVRSLVQAEEFGVPLAQVVRVLAEEMRDKRRQRAAAKAQTVPLKLLFPMMVCLLPVLFIVMLTPTIMNLGKIL